MRVADNNVVGAESGEPAESSHVTLLLFAAARVAAGTRRDTLTASTVAEALAAARDRYGEAFGAVLDGSKVWVNGAPAAPTDPLLPGDEVAILPPVSGGATT
jgi:molybdopterin converting factor small subunit